MKRLTIDRFEGGKAVLICENGDVVTLDRTALPKRVREGDVLDFADGSCYLNAEETEHRRQQIRTLMESLIAPRDADDTTRA